MSDKSIIKGKKTRYWVIGSIVILIAIFVALRFIPARANTASGTATESAGKVVAVNLAETVDASGSLEAQPSASLTWDTDGVVDQVYVKVGDKVKAGDVLMKLKTTSVDASIISAQSDLVTAQKDLDNLLTTSDTDLAQAVIDLKNAQDAYDKADKYLQYLQTSTKIPQTDVKAYTETKSNSWMYIYKKKLYKGSAPADWITEATNDLALKKAQLSEAQHTYDRLKDGPNAQDVAAAQAKVNAAQATVDSMSVIAPFDGEVLYIENQAGDVIKTGDSAADIANLDHLYIDTKVDESDIANVKVGDPITATLDAVPDLTLKGTVAAIDPVGESDSGLVKYTVRAEIDKLVTEPFLPLGATANLTIQVKPATTAIAVPTNLVKNDGKGEYVLVVQKDGTTSRVDVVTGSIQNNLVMVTGNLKEGDVLASQNGNGGSRRTFGGGN